MASVQTERTSTPRAGARQPAVSLVTERGKTVETMSWRLLHQTAAVLGLTVQRKDDGGRTTLTVAALAEDENRIMTVTLE